MSEIENPYEIADKLWNTYFELDFEAKDKVLEVDPHTRDMMYRDYDRFLSNFQQIAADGNPCMTYRDGWECKRILHVVLPELPATADAEACTISNDITPHMALAFTKPNGRRVYIDWEGNHEDLK